MGGGVALLDFDNDGDLDLYFVNGAAIPSLRKTTGGFSNRLYRNEGNWSFRDVTANSGAQGVGYGMGVAAGDIDNDGLTDLYVTGYGANQLLHNRGEGRFEDWTDRTGTRGGGWSASAVFFDYDRDGWLDLYVARYLEYPLGGESSACGDRRLGRVSYCLPDPFPGAVDLLFHNRGDGTFEEVGTRVGIGVNGKGLGVVATDIDRNGWPDLLVANDRTRNLLFYNLDGKRFEERGLPTGFALSMDGAARSGMGIAAGDFDNDGWPDVAVSNFDAEGVSLSVNQMGEFFIDKAGATGLLEATFPWVGFGLAFLDFDNDGHLDLLSINGHILDDVELYRDDRTQAQPDLLLANRGGRFEPLTLPGWGVGRGAAVGDLDNDGDLDVVVGNNNQRPNLLRNDSPPTNHYLTLKLRGRESNRDGSGARLTARCQNLVQTLEAGTGSSYLSSRDPRVHFGLGGCRRLDSLEIQWPSGLSQTFRDVVSDQFYAVGESDPRLLPNRDAAGKK